jgi:hypothetical protein
MLREIWDKNEKKGIGKLRGNFSHWDCEISY